MNFYIFTSKFDLIPSLEKAGFEGALFVYNALSDDKFIMIARTADKNTRIKHMVAIRPYVISPQYLCMINRSINDINPNILQLNLISGHIKDEEKDFGGIVGPVNHYSTRMERSKYLVDFIDSLENVESDAPDYFVSVTNQFTFEAAKKHGSKMIIPYSQYIDKTFDLTDTKSMISITPILRKTHEELSKISNLDIPNRIDMGYFTYDEFEELIKKIENDNIHRIILSYWNEEEQNEIINFVRKYKGRAQ